MEGFSTFRGPSFVSYNAHVLTYLAVDVDKYGNWDTISHFLFANKSQIIKNDVLPGPKVLKQVLRPAFEREFELLSKPLLIVLLPLITF